jgi:hypothetical protein
MLNCLNAIADFKSSSLPPNLRFETDDIEERWTYQDKFDFIHSRMLTGRGVHHFESWGLTFHLGILKNRLHLKLWEWSTDCNTSIANWPNYFSRHLSKSLPLAALKLNNSRNTSPATIWGLRRCSSCQMQRWFDGSRLKIAWMERITSRSDSESGASLGQRQVLQTCFGESELSWYSASCWGISLFTSLFTGAKD